MSSLRVVRVNFVDDTNFFGGFFFFIPLYCAGVEFWLEKRDVYHMFFQFLRTPCKILRFVGFVLSVVKLFSLPFSFFAFGIIIQA